MNNLPANGTDLYLTAHAKERIGERKLNPAAVELVRRHGDQELRTRNGCMRLRITRGMAKRLDRERISSRRTIDDARETELVVTGDRQHCVTAWRWPADEWFRRSGARPRIHRTRRWEEE